MEAPFFPRSALVVGGLVRVAYGLHALLAPEGGGVDRIVGGSLALNGVGLAWWLAALARLSRR